MQKQKKNTQGFVINILDAKIFGLNPDYYTYTLSKQAMYGLTKMSALSYSSCLRVNGIAPGKAPINTESGVFCFKGVYTQAYKKIEILAKKAVLRLMIYKEVTPTKVKITPINKADFECILPAGSGRFWVRIIRLSKSFSNT